MPSRATRALLILLLAGAVTICGCGGSSSEVEPAERSVTAAREAAAGPLSGVIAQLESEDDEREHKESEEEAPESAEERGQAAEEAQGEAAQRREGEERTIEEEAHVGANGSTS